MSESTTQNGQQKSTSTAALWLRRAWPWIRRLLTIAFFGLVLWLLVNQARNIDWQEVKQALLSYSLWRVALALLLAAASYAVYASYDLIGRHFIKTTVSKFKTMSVAFMAFAFNLNLGTLVGSIGIRYRLYTQLGLGKAEVAHVVGLTATTNWLGYLLLAGVAFASGTVDVPFDWYISNVALRFLGAGFIAVVALYLALCQFSPKRTLHVRGHELTLPSTKLAIAQLGMASAHWLLMNCVIFTFLYTEVGFVELLGVLLVSSIAGAIAHIPGALGVLEAVFIVFLGDNTTKSQLVAALIAYRAVFYLAPLAVALCIFLYIELITKRNKSRKAR